MEHFIEKAKLIHYNKYDYSKINYIGINTTKLLLICSKHGEFTVRADKHLYSKRGCQKCTKEKAIENQRYTQDDFINKAFTIFGNLYDYSKVNYIDSKTKVIIICNKHGEFQKQPAQHLLEKGCYMCSKENVISNRDTKEDFIDKANERHNFKYDYSKVKYINSTTKVKIICKEHGIFEQKPSAHVHKQGCPKCGNSQIGKKLCSSNEKFIQKSIEIHGNKYDYSKVDYVNSNTKVIIICKEHGDFEQTPNSHTYGKGCMKCRNMKIGKTQLYNIEKFIEKANQTHNSIYDYTNTEYINSITKVKIICKEHGEFEQIPSSHLRGYGCPKCNKIGFSKSQLEWLDFVQLYENINIRHVKNGDEYNIPNTKFKTDGFCKETNTVYEFHGDYWHGNPEVFNSDNLTHFGVRFGELYKKTLEREKIIKDLGYNLVVMWENKWKRMNKSFKILQKQFRKIKI